MNYFQLFDLPEQFELDLTELGSRYLVLQKRFHPDNFAAGSERDRLLAVQNTANINDAYHSLKHPLLRAEHMLAIRGIKLSNEQRSFSDPAFLMQQMEWREQLADLVTQPDPEQVLYEIEGQLQQQRKALLNALHQALSVSELEQDQYAAELVRKLKFIYKLQQELELIEQQLQD